MKNIVFDLGGVLIDLDRQAAIDGFNQIGFHEAANLLDPYLQQGVFLRMESGEIDAAAFRSYIHSRIKASQRVTDQMIDDAFNRFLVTIPIHKLRLLKQLRTRFNVYMLSNTNPISAHYAINTLFRADGGEVYDYFDHLFLSYQMGMLKPHEDIFRKMLRDGAFEASQTLFVDDSAANITTAQRLGFEVYLAKEHEDFSEIFKNI